ncbi:pre-mRNA-splicing factor 38B [Zeugodacus cucurbitae]|uniref:pre-mRNA-splicing factor 38B n=1 Tax=Zeugodacus cucurbitae TaxID=28588 RepID=UPI0010A741CB|nr:pre-mRNA-splicing factor 38B [Zeugodacus cucurbitae]
MTTTRDSQTATAKIATTAATTMTTCDEHEYDEYCPEQYEAHHHHHHGSAQAQTQTQCERERDRDRERERDRDRERERERDRERERERDAHHRHSSSRAGAAAPSALKHQRAATFDVADARDYELQRLGNRRSQQQQQLQQQLQQATGGGGSSGKYRGNEHRGERTHDRERSRSDHRIATYACDDTALCGSSNNTGGHHQTHLANGGITQSSRQQRREKTFKV